MAHGIFIFEEEIALAMSLKALAQEYSQHVKIIYSTFSTQIDLNGQIWDYGIVSINPITTSTNLVNLAKNIMNIYCLKGLMILTVCEHDLYLNGVVVVDKGLPSLIESVEIFLKKSIIHNND